MKRRKEGSGRLFVIAKLIQALKCRGQIKKKLRLMTSRWTQKQFAHKLKCSHVGMACLVTCKKSLSLYKMVSLLFLFNCKNLIIATFNYKLRLNLKYTSGKKVRENV